MLSQRINLVIQTLEEAKKGLAVFPDMVGLPESEVGQLLIEDIAILENRTDGGKTGIVIKMKDIVTDKLYIAELSVDTFAMINGAVKGAEARFAILKGRKN
jgi:hypothetical protein